MRRNFCSVSFLLTVLAFMHSPHIVDFPFFPRFSALLLLVLYILFFNCTTRENNEKKPAPNPDAVSLKTAHSGVKFEILISKKFNSARTAYNQSFFLFASAFSLSCPFLFAPSLAMFAGVAMRVGCSKASNVSINAVARSQILAFDCVFCLHFDSTYLQPYTRKKF